METPSKLIQLGSCLEQVTPGIRYNNTLPGESFERDIDALKAIQETNPSESLGHLLRIIDRLTELPNEDFIKVVGIFEHHLMHRGLE